ncbi:MAG: hypothetical protein K0Q87_3419 [Neobacillus sp.]|nr:hypothetical protein [Neobacillus sp.]
MKRNADTFEEFLNESFRDGISCRELRLSTEELAYVKVKYPLATIKGLPSDVSADGKSWYEVALSSAMSEKVDPSRDVEDIRQENKRLKLEIEALKKIAVK